MKVKIRSLSVPKALARLGCLEQRPLGVEFLVAFGVIGGQGP